MVLRKVFDRLYAHYGPQQWWPGETPFEVMVGAVLTQNTAWSNVEKAIGNLQANAALSPDAILATPPAQLAAWLRPSGYFNVKAARLREFCRWYVERSGLAGLQALPTEELRRELLAVKGIGPETADDILLYAFERPVFVVDAYTRRIFSRLALITGEEDYEEVRGFFEQDLGGSCKDNVALFNEYHALIVVHAKEACRKKPACKGCPLRRHCNWSMTDLSSRSVG
jgi:endonuclease-3 related protein